MIDLILENPNLDPEYEDYLKKSLAKSKQESKIANQAYNTMKEKWGDKK